MNDQHEESTDRRRNLDAMLGVEWALPPLFPQAGRSLDRQSGKIGWAILWLLGVPLPLLLIAYLIWGH